MPNESQSRHSAKKNWVEHNPGPGTYLGFLDVVGRYQADFKGYKMSTNALN